MATGCDVSEPIARDQIEHIARLARLKLSEDEVTRFQGELSQILTHMAQLDALDTTHVEPTAHPLPIRNVWREDEPRPSFGSDQALANAPQREGAFFAVPRVLKNESSG
jgi:aspartyl-tRNA(Asn)/glutamyl-tRNA(Gln) amidotransferase subunit C